MLRSGPLLPLLGQSNQTCLHQPKQEKKFQKVSWYLRKASPAGVQVCHCSRQRWLQAGWVLRSTGHSWDSPCPWHRGAENNPPKSAPSRSFQWIYLGKSQQWDREERGGSRAAPAPAQRGAERAGAVAGLRCRQLRGRSAEHVSAAANQALHLDRLSKLLIACDII